MRRARFQTKPYRLCLFIGKGRETHAVTEQELFRVLDDLAHKVTALVRAGKTSVGAPPMQAIDALEKVYPSEYAKWADSAKRS